MPFDDDAEADNPGFRPPPHPDDRLWRHPSEMNAHPIVPVGASTPPFIPTSAAAADADRRRRPWGAYLAAGALGAVVAGGGVIALGLGETVVERPVTERVALSPTLAGADDPDPLETVHRDVAPAVVGIEADPAAAGEPATASEPAAIAGSGVIVRDDGIVITSAALAAVGTVPTLRLPDGSRARAQVLAVDEATGLAVLDLGGEGYTPSVLARDAELRPGAQMYVLTAAGDDASDDGGDGGSDAFGTDGDDATDAGRDEGGGGRHGPVTTGTGTVGATERYVGPSATALDGVAIAGAADAAALGGPVVNERGAVVGIVTTVEASEAWYVAPVEVAHKVADDVLAEGAVQHSWLGIEGTDVAGDRTTGSPATTLETEGGGTLVVSVVPDSPADQGGLTSGDVITALDGEAIARMPDLLVALRSRSPGERIDVSVTRADGDEATLELTLTTPPTP